MAGGEPETTDGMKSFGAALKGFRDRAGMSRETLAEQVGYSVHQLASVERGRRFPSRKLVDGADEVLDAEGILLEAYKPLKRRRGLASWFHGWSETEEEARTLFAYECRTIPGLLQSEGYARAVFESRLPLLSEEQIETQLAARMDRQRLLREKQNTEFGFIIEQALLERCTGGPDVTRGLIDHILACIELRNVEVKIMPLRQEQHAGLDGSLYLAETPDHEWLGYVESHDTSMLVSDRKQVSSLIQRYGKMRAQALSQEDSIRLLERLRGEL
jgi:transcriptional regulator with XRE-family HTH domain